MRIKILPLRVVLKVAIILISFSCINNKSDNVDQINVGTEEDLIYLSNDEFIESISSETNQNILDVLDGHYNSIYELPSKSFRIMALSNIAEGLLKIAVEKPESTLAIASILENLVMLSISSDINPYTENVNMINDFTMNGLYSSHLNIILGVYQNISKTDKFKVLNTKISMQLNFAFINNSDHHIYSYSGIMYKWPADQTASLYSLFLYDMNYDSDISVEPVRYWINYMNQYGLYSDTSLHISEITGALPYSNIPRGCALSWSIKYMSEFAPEEAKKMWDEYVNLFLVDILLFSGFREVPEGISFIPDSDSGPIFMEVGSAATAFGMAAALGVEDFSIYTKLRKCVDVGYSIVDSSNDSSLIDTAHNLLSEAVVFSSDI